MNRILRGEVGIGKKPKDIAFAEARKLFKAWAETNRRPSDTGTAVYRSTPALTAKAHGGGIVPEAGEVRIVRRKAIVRPVQS